MFQAHTINFWLLEICLLALGWLVMAPVYLFVDFMTGLLKTSLPTKRIVLISMYSISYFYLSTLHLKYTGQHFSLILIIGMMLREAALNSENKKQNIAGLLDSYIHTIALAICLIIISITRNFSLY